MGHNASLQLFGKQETATTNNDPVTPEKFKRLESTMYVINEGKSNPPSNAGAMSQESSLEKSNINGYGTGDKGTYKEEYKHKLSALEAEKQQLIEAIDRLTARSTSNVVRSGSMENEFIGRINMLEAEIQQLNDENHKLLTRLSEIGAIRLTENNGNIADLSDASTPHRLAEQMSELFDSEWTKAFQHLTQTEGLQDEDTVRRLLHILKEIYKICLNSTRKQTEDLKKAVLSYLGLSEENKDDVIVKETEKRLREYRLTQLEPTLGCVLKDIKYQLKDRFEGNVHDTLDKYIQKCTRLCWLMGIRNPQMHLDFYSSQINGTPEDDANKFLLHFDTTKFVSYTNFGMYMDYIVWPALFLYKDGPLIKRGVAQGFNRGPDVKTPNVQRDGAKSRNIDDKSVFDAADREQDAENSESDFTNNSNEDDALSQYLSDAKDMVQTTTSENTVHSNSPNFDGHNLSSAEEDDSSLYEDVDAKLWDDSS
ncbi:hypothetical protein ACJMK2_031939 [Sinanodonta woodiana]|uniref:Mitochondria-eating protein C-terminal domain-containing protein n=1 Tax=Sinanodonta woodiana TaxID=1069815 RepID=A0ABD3X3Q5_SINWO